MRYEKKINDETSLKNEEIENLKKQVIREKQNNKLQKSQIENEVRNEFILEQDEIVRKIEQNIKNKYELKFKQFQIKENEYKKEIIHLHDK